MFFLFPEGVWRSFFVKHSCERGCYRKMSKFNVTNDRCFCSGDALRRDRSVAFHTSSNIFFFHNFFLRVSGFEAALLSHL
jgi:hypothetical protein